jgi:hypothetical protein
MATICPFRISRPASDQLARNEAFRAVRDNLRRQELGSEAPRFVSFVVRPLFDQGKLTCH